MTTRESQVKALLEADVQLMAILTGGVWTDEEVGIEGIRRGDDSPTAIAFDADGYLKPCVVIRQSGELPFPGTQSPGQNFTGEAMTIQLFFYQNRGHDQLELAKRRSWTVLNNKRLGASYPIWCDFQSGYLYDVGALQNSTTFRQDWRVVSTRQD